MDENGIVYDKVAVVTNNQFQRLPALFMNSFQSKEDVELFQMYNQDNFHYHHMNVKVICYECFHDLSFLSFMNNIIFFCFYIKLKVLMIL